MEYHEQLPQSCQWSRLSVSIPNLKAINQGSQKPNLSNPNPRTSDSHCLYKLLMSLVAVLIARGLHPSSDP